MEKIDFATVDLETALELAGINEDEDVFLCRTGTLREEKTLMKASDVKRQYDTKKTKVLRITPCIDNSHHYITMLFQLYSVEFRKSTCSPQSNETPTLNTNGCETELPPIFFDMDGTLVKWEDSHIDDVMAPGFFQHKHPVMSMVEAARILIRRGYPVCSLSKVIGGTTAAEDKDAWINKFLPEISKERRFYVPYENPDKNALALEGGIKPYYLLIDDSTHYGLSGWKGIGIKVDNGINNTNRSWKGYMLSSQSDPEKIADTIAAIAAMEKEKYIRDTIEAKDMYDQWVASEARLKLKESLQEELV